MMFLHFNTIDLRKSIIVRPPTIYRGEISPQGVRCQETQVDEKSLLFISTDESGRDDCTNVLDVESLKGSRDKVKASFSRTVN